MDGLLQIIQSKSCVKPGSEAKISNDVRTICRRLGVCGGIFTS